MIKHSLAAAAALCALLAVSPLASATCISPMWSTQQTQPGAITWLQNLETLDYDGDGVLDLVGAIGTAASSGTNTLYSWRGVGDGTFQAPVSLGTADLSDLAVADVNNDGRKDLIMTTWHNTMIVRLGTGSGFGPEMTTGLNHTENFITAVQFDGDPYIDLVATSVSSNIFIVYHGQGNGNFTEVSRVATGNWPTDVAAADFDGDGRMDVAYGVRLDKKVVIAFQNAGGTFAAPATVMADFDWPSALVAGDFNEDGKPDLAAARNTDTALTEPAVFVFPNLGSRAFGSATMLPSIPHVLSGYWTLRMADINGDGHLDLIPASANSKIILTYPGLGDGTFRSPAFYQTATDNVDSVAVGDFDGDSDLDMAVGGYGNFITAKNNCGAQVYLNTLSPVITAGNTAPLRAAVAGIASTTPLPRGTVTFKEGATILGTADVDANGLARLEAPGLSVGNHTITAEFGGNSEEGGGTSQSIVQTVTTDYTTTTILFPPAGSVYGTPFTFTIDVHRANGDTGYGYCTLEVDGASSELWIPDGTVQATLNLLPGQHTITAYYRGYPAYYPASSSGPHTITTAKASPGIGTSGALTVRSGETHTVQFTVAGPVGAATPTGTVQLKEGSTVLGGGALSGGVFTISTTLPRGGHDIVLSYSGDSLYNAAALNLTLSVLPNVPFAIDARGLQSAISIRAVLPPNTTGTTLYRRPAGTTSWTAVGSWPASEFDPGPLTRGVLYEYRVDAIVNNVLQSSNIDAALMFNDDTLPAGSLIKRLHFDELRLSINALRCAAGLPAFNFDGTYPQGIVRASHLASMRNALTEARSALGMTTPAFTDPAASGMTIKKVHIQELREQAR